MPDATKRRPTLPACQFCRAQKEQRLKPQEVDSVRFPSKPAPLMFAGIVLLVFVIFMLAILFWNQMFPDAIFSPGRT